MKLVKKPAKRWSRWSRVCIYMYMLVFLVPKSKRFYSFGGKCIINGDKNLPEVFAF